MANTRGGSAVMEEVRVQVNQLQIDMERMTKEIADRDVQLRDQLTTALKEQNETMNKSIEERMGRMEVMFERIMKGKEQEGTKDQPPPINTSGAGVLGASPFTNPNSNTENSYRRMPENNEGHFGEQFGAGEGYRRDMGNSRSMQTTIQLPRMDFPSFDGANPSDWVMKCEYYFEIYQIPHIHKTRMAVINFVGEASAWYMHFRKGIENPPWELLVDEVFNRFTQNAAQELIGEFKRLHQISKVQEYIKQFDALRAKLMHERPYLPHDFYVSAFVEGLRDDIKAMVTMFKPQALNDAYNLAGQYEAVQDSQFRRMRFVPKPISQPTN